ncbi:hypothetical protein KGF54_003661 [Candida jiufengensis]|uniref:uncharacterized protein n=1 Tax=Candida jiufengensis TaxID=497108 RepID=UPI002224E92A|nr:uncharacterized protein KGF54_003661 [Candida jiufengensis]KAI5952794.1 hypothetical protein KGF54_003661 [Candida jiufengensis]
MSETIDSRKQPPQSRLKQLTSGSSWVSPFRSTGEDENTQSKKKSNLHQQFREDNKMEHIKVPAKFAHHPTLEAEAKKKKQAAATTKKSTTTNKTTTAATTKKPTTTTTTTTTTKKPADTAKKVEKNLDDKSKEKLITDEPKEKLLTDEPQEKLLTDEPPQEKLITDEPQEKLLTDEPKVTNGEAEEKKLEDSSKEKLLTDEPSTTKAQAEADELEDTSKEKLLTDGPAVSKSKPTEAEKYEEAADKHEQKADKLISDVKEDIKKSAEEAEEDLNGDDNIKKLVKKDPIELNVAPEAKFEPVDRPNKEILEKLKDKPVLLKHYQELNATAVGSIANDVDDPKKVIELGSGLRMTQQQLLDLAAKRVAPVITSINKEVSKTKQEDEIKKQHILDQKVKKHEVKLRGEFEKYAAKVSTKQKTFDQEIKRKLDGIEKQKQTSITTAKDFDKQTKKEIATAKKDFEDREKKAVEQHKTDKETLEKNHDELLATKKQELEDSKTNQEKTTQEIEQLQDKKVELDNKNSELSDEIEKLLASLNEDKIKLDELKTKYETEAKAIDSNDVHTKELNDKLSGYDKDLEAKKSTHKTLTAEVAALGAVLGAYGAKLTDLHSDKEQRGQRLTDAKQKYNDWQTEKDSLAAEAAREHEKQRVQATQEYETRKHQEELERKRQKEEEERLAEEEKQRKLKEEAEEKERIAKEEELAKQRKLEEEQRQKEEELKAKELKEKQKKEASVTSAIKDREAKQKTLEEERNKHDSLYKKGSYEGDETKYQDAQKQRLEDEIVNLKKIKHLREERSTYTGEDPKSSELDALINERERAISKIDKQKQKILDEKAAASKKAENERLAASKKAEDEKLAASKNAANYEALGGSGAVGLDSAHESQFKPVKKDATYQEPSKQIHPNAEEEEKQTSSRNVGKNVTAGALGGAGLGAGAAALSGGHNNPAEDYSSSKIASAYNPNDAVPNFDQGIGKSKDVDFGSSTTNKNTGVASGVVPKGDQTVGGVNAKDVEPKKDHTNSKTAAGAAGVIGAAGAAGYNSGSRRDDASWEVQSVYEIISDAEYEAHKNNPDYFEISEAEYKKHKNLEEKVTLIEEIA